MLKAHQLSIAYGSTRILNDITLNLTDNQVIALIGANGSGKSTLLKTLTGQLSPKQGSVTLNGKEINRYRRREIAQQMAFIPQFPQAPEGLTVAQVIAHGTFARDGFWGKGDPTEIDAALAATDLNAFADNPFDYLSGGQKQRVWIALALVQKPKMILLDEPISHLDMGYQLAVLRLLRKLQQDHQVGILMVLHDINQASFFADRIICLKDGQIYADGSPQQVITSQLVQDVFHADADIQINPKTNRPVCLPREYMGLNAVEA